MNPDIDLASIDGLLQALYRTICFPPGGRPDWDTLLHLCLPDAQMVRVGTPDRDGNDCLSVERFMELSMDFLADSPMKERGFEEVEVMRHTETFGRIAHIFSSYESRFFGESRLLARGTNSIQLLRKDGRWWLVSILWDEEDPSRGNQSHPAPRSASEVKTIPL